jgi:hypothetical protein
MIILDRSLPLHLVYGDIGGRNLKHNHFCNTRLDDLRFRLNFNLSKNNEIYHHSWKERLEISNITKFGCEML